MTVTPNFVEQTKEAALVAGNGAMPFRDAWEYDLTSFEDQIKSYWLLPRKARRCVLLASRTMAESA